MTLNWKQPFVWPSVYWNEVARQNRNRLLVIHNAAGNHQLYSLDRESGKFLQLSDEKGGKVFGSISSQGNWIFYLDDNNGSEMGHIVRVPFNGGQKEDISTSLPAYSSFFVRTSVDDAVYTWTAAMDNRHTVFCVHADTDGKMTDPVLIYHSANFIDTPIISASGRYVCFDEETVNGPLTHHTTQIFDMHEHALHTVAIPAMYPDVQPVSFLGSQEETIIATCRKWEYKRPVLVNILTGLVTELSLEGIDGDIHPLFYDADRNALLISSEHQARQRLYLYFLETKAVQEINFGSGSFLGWFGSAHITKDGKVLMQWEDGGHPACMAEVGPSLDTPDPLPLYPHGNHKADAQWEEVCFPSESGHSIQAWMMKSSGEGPAPFVISAHGGPHSVSLDAFAPEALMWVQKGFGYIAVNYSGSLSFGEQFKTSIRGKPGILEAMDMVAARKFLVDSNLADPDSIILTGWSWGGFITLLTLGLYPELWAAGIAGIPVADAIASYEDESPSMKTLDHELFGGDPRNVGDVYRSSSPIAYTANIQAPVLIIHAKNDTRCPARQVENFITKMKEDGKNIQVHWFNSGHLGHFSDPKIAISNYEVALNFVNEWLPRLDSNQ